MRYSPVVRPSDPYQCMRMLNNFQSVIRIPHSSRGATCTQWRAVCGHARIHENGYGVCREAVRLSRPRQVRRGKQSCCTYASLLLARALDRQSNRKLKWHTLFVRMTPLMFHSTCWAKRIQRSSYMNQQECRFVTLVPVFYLFFWANHWQSIIGFLEIQFPWHLFPGLWDTSPLDQTTVRRRNAKCKGNLM